MTEDQLRLFPAFKGLPVHDESDERADHITSGGGTGRKVCECKTMRQVEECLADPGWVPLGWLRVGVRGQQVVVVYFGERT